MSTDEIKTLLNKPFAFDQYGLYKQAFLMLTGKPYSGCDCSKVDLYNKLKMLIKTK